MSNLSAAQASIWAGHQLSDDKCLYNTSECLFFSQKIDPKRLETAIVNTVRAYETLSCHYRARTDGTGERIPASIDATLTLEDLGHQTPSETFIELWAINFDAAEPFDLHHGLPCRFTLFSGLDGDALLISVHHIALDGFGYQLFLERLAANYATPESAQDKTPPMSNVIDEERAFVSSPACGVARAYWQEKLALIEDAPRFGRTSTIGRGYHKVTAPMPQSLWKDLTQASTAAKSVRVNWADLLTGAFAAALSEATGASTISIGLPAMNRMGSVVAKIPCMQMNIVPLVMTTEEGDSLLSLAAKVASEKKAMRKHVNYRHESIARDRLAEGKSPQIFGPVINIMPFARSIKFEAIEAKRYVVNSGPAADITLAVFCASPHSPPELEFCAHPEVLAKEDLQAKAQQFLSLCSDLANAPQDRISAVMDSRRERAISDAIIDGPGLAEAASPVLLRIKVHAQVRPQQVAVEHQGQTLTYAALVTQMNTWAASLKEHGVATGMPVGVMLPRSLDAIVAALAVMEAGGVYVPFDQAQPDTRQSQLWQTSKAHFLITGETPDPNVFANSFVLTPEALREAAPSPGLANQADAAYMMFTSGSTGAPKGIVISHNALNHFAAAVNARYQIAPEDRVLQFAPFHFDASIEEIFVTLTHGATLVLRTNEMLGSFASFSKAVDAMQVSVLDLPTAWWNEWSEALASGQSTLPKTLRTVILGGESVTTQALAQWQSCSRESIRLINSYGPTETTVVALTADLSAWRPGDDIAIGTPIPGVSCVVLGPGGYPDSEGELVIIGPTVGSHYLGTQGLLRATLAHMDLPAYRTGDRVRRHGASLSFVGRIDHEVKISGHRIQPAEIEKAVLAISGITAASVEVMRNDRGSTELAVFVVSPTHSIQSLRVALRAALPAVMVPKHLRIVSTLPKTLSGKIDHAALRNMLGGTIASMTPADRSDDSSIYARVRAVWEQEFAPLIVADNDSFFSLGGQSLQAMQLALRLSQALGHEVTVADVLTYPTLSAFAHVMETRLPDNKAAADSNKYLQPTLLSSAAVRTIFAFPGVGGSSAQFLALAKILKEHANVSAFEAPSPKFASEQRSVSDWGKTYAEAVVAQQPSGLVYLMGHSFGGWLAYETAKQLEANGREVALYLLDTVAPEQAPAGDIDGFLAKLAQHAVHFDMAEAKRSALYQLELHKSYKPDGFILGAVCRMAARETNIAQAREPWFKGPVKTIDVPADHYTILTEGAIKYYQQSIIDSLHSKDRT